MIDDIIAEREKTHGDFTVGAEIVMRLIGVIGEADRQRFESGRGQLSDTASLSLLMISAKIARILAGDPDCVEHWNDISGYAKLVSDRLRPQPEAPFDAEADSLASYNEAVKICGERYKATGELGEFFKEQ